MTIANAPVAVGEVLAGKYRVERLLGMGNMGVVVEASHITMGTRVALKFLLAQRASSHEVHERFLREAKAAGSLKSQHVARVSDCGSLESGAPYLVMELLEGRDLAAVLDERERLAIPEAVEYLLQVCEAVGEAHRQGIVHRDLKPANLFLIRDTGGLPCVKVLDFGVSKLRDQELKLTHEGAMMGSPLYMSPEQMLGKLDVDERADVWALGVVLYELVAGYTPFHSETIMALQTAVLVKPPKPLTHYLPDAPPAFEAVLLQALDKEPARRWPNVAALAAALAPFAPARAAGYVERVASARGVVVGGSRATEVLSLDTATRRAAEPAANVPALTVMATTSGATSQAAAVKASPSTGAGAAILGAGLLALALAAGALVRWRTEPTAPAATTSAAAPQTSPDAGPRIEMTVEPVASASAPMPVVPTVAPSASVVPATAIKPKVPKGGPIAPATQPPAPAPVRPKNLYND